MLQTYLSHEVIKLCALPITLKRVGTSEEDFLEYMILILNVGFDIDECNICCIQ